MKYFLTLMFLSSVSLAGYEGVPSYSFGESVIVKDGQTSAEAIKDLNAKCVGAIAQQVQIISAMNYVILESTGCKTSESKYGKTSIINAQGQIKFLADNVKK